MSSSASTSLEKRASLPWSRGFGGLALEPGESEGPSPGSTRVFSQGCPRQLVPKKAQEGPSFKSSLMIGALFRASYLLQSFI